MQVHRQDDQWIQDLTSTETEQRDSAIVDLQDMLIRGLGKSLSKHGKVDDAFLEDVAQEATLKILSKVDSFEGRSKFRTWAVTIAVRTAISEMRKKEWQNVSLETLTENAELEPQQSVTSEIEDASKEVDGMMSKLQQLIESDLTEKQWTAITAELRGMPLRQVAEKMGSNPNSLYKLLHDARKKLRQGLEAAGYSIDDISATLN